MTEKRFTYEEINFCNDNYTGNQYDLTNPNEMLELLNELYEENQELQGKYDAQKQLYYQLNSNKNNIWQDYQDLKKENEHLKIRFKEEKDTAMRLGSQCDTLTIQNHELKRQNEQLKRLLREVEHELTSLTGLSCFDKCASQLGYVEVFDKDMWELDYTKLLAKIEKELKE